MLFQQKNESYSIGEFLKGPHRKRISSTPKVYSFMGLDMTSQSLFGASAFNMPYYLVFGVAGVALASVLLEYILIAHGYERRAEMVESFTKLIMPLAFYGFLVFGMLSIL